MKPRTLTRQQMDAFALAARSTIEGGWSGVDARLVSLVAIIPASLVEMQREQDGTTRVRLTPEGEALVSVSPWLGFSFPRKPADAGGEEA